MDNIFFQYIAKTLRKSKRVRWLFSLLAGIFKLWYDDRTAHKNCVQEANVTSQKLSLEAYLNLKIYGSIDIRLIKINTNLPIKQLYISLTGEIPKNTAYFPQTVRLTGEIGEFGMYDILVEVPVSISEQNKVMVDGILQKYIPLGFTYIITTY